MTEQETAALIAQMTVIWEHITADDYTLNAWHWALGHMPYPVVAAELGRWVQTNRHAPRPAEILERIAEREVAMPTPEAAWGLVLERMAWPLAVGQTAPPRWDPPGGVREALLSVGTITTLRESRTLAADRKTFLEAYTAIRRREIEAVQTGDRPIAALAPGATTTPRLVPIGVGLWGNDAAATELAGALEGGMAQLPAPRRSAS